MTITSNADQTSRPGIRKAKVEIRRAWCKGCEFCVATCPQDVLRMDGLTPLVEKPDRCTGCELCVWICPDFAIEVTVETKANGPPVEN